MTQYPEFVIKDRIKCFPPNKEYRYSLDIEFKGNNSKKKTAMIIMQNPSQANKTKSDKTVNKVLNYLYRFRHSKVIIMNIIPFYGTDISNILKKDYKNSEILDLNLKK